MIRSLFSITALLGASVLGALAQDKPAVQAKIRLLAFTENLQFEEAYARDPSIQDNASGVLTSIVTSLNPDSTLVPTKSRKIVFTTKPDFASINRPNELIGEATLPASGNSAIFIFLPGKAGDKAKSKIMAIDDSKLAFPAGSYRVVNICPQTVRLALEKKNYDFTPGKELLIAPPPVGAGNRIGMEAYVQKGTAWEVLATSIWSHSPTRRKLSIISQNPASASIELRTFEDMPPREAAAAPPIR